MPPNAATGEVAANATTTSTTAALNSENTITWCRVDGRCSASNR
jgi:hypothetical protein